MDKKLTAKIRRILYMLTLIFTLTSCAAQKSAQTEEFAAPQAADVAVNEEVAKAEGPHISTEVSYNRKMIKTGELHLQTKEFVKSVEAIIQKVQSLEGYVENSSIQGNNFYTQSRGTRSASLVVRMPQKYFDIFINHSSEFGNVLSTSSHTQDITNEYVDTEIRLKTLKTRHERLLSLLQQTGSLNDMFEIEKELGEITYEIERMSGTLQKYDQLVEMSTLNIYIEEVYTIEEMKPIITFSDRISNTFKVSIKGLRNLLEGIVLMIIAIIPFLLIIVPLAAILRIFIKKIKIKRKDKYENNN